MKRLENNNIPNNKKGNKKNMAFSLLHLQRFAKNDLYFGFDLADQIMPEWRVFRPVYIQAVL